MNDYILEQQVGYLLRLATQRHTMIFAEHMVEELTPTQFSTLIKLHEIGPCSQNHLGRLIAMDAATTKGVVDRLSNRGFICAWPDPEDKRRLLVSLTAKGQEVLIQAIAAATVITEQTIAPLNKREQERFLSLLKKIT